MTDKMVMGGSTVPITAVTMPRKPPTRQPTRMAALTAMAPRGGLGQGGEIQHLLLVDPSQLIHKLPLHKGNDDKASPEGKGADVQHTEKQLEQRPSSGVPAPWHPAPFVSIISAGKE